MRFLISKLSSLGDVVCGLPAAVALKNRYPDSNISWIARAPFTEVARCCSAVDEVIEARNSLVRSAWPELEEAYDFALDLQGLFKSAWPIFLAKAREKLGYHWQRDGSFLFTRRILPDPASFHVVDQYVDVARAAGGKMNRAEFALKPPEKEVQEIGTRLQEQRLQPFVAISPGAGWISKRWPESYFVDLVNAVHAKGMNVVLIGGKSEVETGRQIAGRCEREPANWAGQTTLAQVMALLSEAKAHVGGDTGSTHLSAALNVPCLGLYSVTHPRRSSPYGQIENCLYDPISLAAISPEQATRKLWDILN